MKYAHELVALDQKVPEHVIDQILAGKRPSIGEDWDEKSDTAYVMAEKLAHGHGALDQDTWEKSVEIFGQQGTVSLAHCTALYAYMAVLMNACAVPLPEGV